MVAFIKKLPIFSNMSKMDHLESFALQSFHSNISKNLHELFLSKKDGLDFSLSWYVSCLKFIQEMHTSFAKLVNDLDYPFTKWREILVEDYLTYTLNILDALNLISSSISHVGISRLRLSHGLSSNQHLKPIAPKKGVKELNFKEISNVGRFVLGKERVVHETMLKMRGVDTLILKCLLCGFCGERNEDIGKFNWGEFEGVKVKFGDEIVIIKEIKEVNEVVKKIESNNCGEALELKRKLSKCESSLEIVGKEVNCLFSLVLANRNELINCFRLPKCS